MQELLFPPIEDSHIRPKLHNESSYDFCLRSNKPHAIEIRQFWNKIFSECTLPEEAKKDIRGRFTSKSDEQHFGALSELFMYELLKRTGHKLEYQKELKQGRPDYKVTCPDGEQFYLEVTCALGDEHPKKYENTPRGMIDDAISVIKSDKFRVSYSIRGNIKLPDIDRKTIRKKIESFLKSIDYELLIKDQDNQPISQIESIPDLVISIGDAKIFVKPWIIYPKRLNKDHSLVLFASPTGARRVITDIYLHESIKNKADQFKESNLPIIVAVNIFEKFIELSDITTAMFGTPYNTYPFGKIKQVDFQGQFQRESDGIWIHNGKPINKSIAAVWIFSQVEYTVTPSRIPMMVLNPFLDSINIPCNLPFVDYFVPSNGKLVLKRIGADYDIPEYARETVLKDWPFKEDFN